MDLASDDTNAKVFNELQVVVKNFTDLLNEQAQVHLSPQLSKRLAQLLSSFTDPLNVLEIFNRIVPVFNRLLLELIQAQSNTKQREDDFKRLVASKGCSIDPELIDLITELLIRLYKAAQQYSDTSLERGNLIKYVMKELGPNQRHREKHVGRVIQTIYRCSCFHVTPQEGNSSRYRLKEHLYDANELRYQLDVELINLAKANSIRLSPDSWAYLLHGRSTPDNISRMQSILDKHILPVEVNELEVAIHRSSDRLSLGRFMDDLYCIQNLINEIGFLLSLKSDKPASEDMVQDHLQNECDILSKAVKIMEKLLDLRDLFAIRQNRSKLIKTFA